MCMWNVQGQNITKQYGMYRDRTLHNHVDVECTGLEHYKTICICIEACSWGRLEKSMIN